MDLPNEEPEETFIQFSNPNHEQDDDFSSCLASIEFKLVKKGDKVCLEDLQFMYHLPKTLLKSVVTGVLPLSSNSYLLLNWSNSSVVKLDPSFNIVSTTRFDEPLQSMYCAEIDRTRAAVCINRPSGGSTMYIIYTENLLHKIRLIGAHTEEECVGLACINRELYVASRRNIFVYTLTGQRIRAVFQEPKSFIHSITKGTGNSLMYMSGEEDNYASLSAIGIKEERFVVSIEDLVYFNNQDDHSQTEFLDGHIFYAADLDFNVYICTTAHMTCSKVQKFKGCDRKIYDVFAYDYLRGINYDAILNMMVFLSDRRICVRSCEYSKESAQPMILGMSMQLNFDDVSC